MTRLETALAELVAAVREEVSGAAARTETDRLLSIDAAAEALGIKRTTLYREIQAGRLRTLKIGRRRLVPSSAITERLARG